MNANLNELIKMLSLEDKKTLSQKALKATEEIGELAKVILPYDNASSTTHRFVTDKKILEEVADVMLCVMSIAYDLKFSSLDIEEMMAEKALKWSSLINQEKGDNLDLNKIPFEIHVSVENVDREKFIDVAKSLNCKPILLDLQNKDGVKVVEDVMTSSVHLGSNKSAYEEMKRISTGLSEANLKVVREKIETVPWHPAAPCVKRPVEMPKNCYFECHFNIILEPERREELSEICKKFDIHLSSNIFKKLKNGQSTVMATYRKYKDLRENFEEKVSLIRKYLADNHFEVEKTIVEFSIYDTKVSHDSAWLKAS